MSQVLFGVFYSHRLFGISQVLLRMWSNCVQVQTRLVEEYVLCRRKTLKSSLLSYVCHEVDCVEEMAQSCLVLSKHPDARDTARGILRRTGELNRIRAAQQGSGCGSTLKEETLQDVEDYMENELCLNLCNYTRGEVPTADEVGRHFFMSHIISRKFFYLTTTETHSLSLM